ncbi:MAG: UDP-3-O-[3-hydroxymyristoyl] N-acetylglucosamine deacetylase [Alphaproteobacteria bacterium 40-19]|nr:MAG: UDP-3-O-[3-hydroxymyristoyl] N-acetylglucosamine deacetylase [Alphaproteobacteria bacterium 40-19]
MQFRKTIQHPVQKSGIGVHQGQTATFVLNPAPCGQGLGFRKEGKGNIFPLSPQAIRQSFFQTVLCFEEDFWVYTPEHLLSACYGLGITDLVIDLWGPELPIFDGSASSFVQALLEGGMIEFCQETQWMVLEKEISIQTEKGGLTLYPGSPVITFDLCVSPYLTQQAEFILENKNFITEIAPARTFTQAKHVEELQKKGLIQGGSLECAVVLDDQGKPVNKGGWRLESECARHKILDILGDFCLLNLFFYGRIQGKNSGHHLNALVLQKLLESPQAWRCLPFSKLPNFISKSH